MLDILRQQLRDDLIAGTRWCVALSGGVDSTVLLHGLTQLAAEFSCNTVRAVHVNHHLHADADSWAESCRSLCTRLGVPLACCDVSVETNGNHGLEAAARNIRYETLSGLLEPGEILLTAHHLDDQVETFLLRLLRGAGPHGLAGIEPRRSYGEGWLVRPLLQVSRAVIEVYAHNHGLNWIEDPANTDTSFDRNFLRHRVLPVMSERWPGLGQTIPRAARLSAQASRMLDELAEQDIATAGEFLDAHGPDTLLLDVFRGLSPERRRNVARFWLRRLGLPPPPEVRLQVGLEQLLDAGPDRMPLVAWGGVQIRRYRNHLYVLDFDPDLPQSTQPRNWDGCGRIDLQAPRGTLRFVHRDGKHIDVPRNWTVRFRSGGESFEMGGRHKSLGSFFQERGVVPWMRPHIPLLYRDDQLVAVGDLWQADRAGGEEAPSDARVEWDGHPRAL